MDFFAVKVDGSDVIAGISLYENIFTDIQYKHFMTFSSDKIYYNFSQENPKITNI